MSNGEWTLIDEFDFMNVYVNYTTGDTLTVPQNSAKVDWRFILRMNPVGNEHGDDASQFRCQSRWYGIGMDTDCSGPLQAHMGTCVGDTEWGVRYYCTTHGEMASLRTVRGLRKAHEDATHTVANAPQLLAIWADDTDPSTVRLDSEDKYQMACPAGHIVTREVRMWRGWLAHHRQFAAQTEPITSKRWMRCCQHGSKAQDEARAEMLPAGTSRVELMHHSAAEAIFGAAESGARLSNPDFARQWSVDILVDKLVIEYDGRRWHAAEDRRIVDTRKTMDLLDAGYTVVRLREDGLESLHIQHPNYREINVSASSPKPSDVINAVKLWTEQAA